MARLDKQRESELQPKRLAFAKEAIMKMGYEITFESKSEINFYFRDAKIKFFPYSGWHSGATIKDGRGLNNLLKQLMKGL